jgi:general secretion pathway protein C
MTSIRLHAGHLLIGLLLIAVAWAGWRTLRTLAEPTAPAAVLLPAVVADRGALAARDPFFGARPAAESLPVTALALTLHGVRTDVATGRGTAIVSSGDGEQTLFSPGEAITPGVVLAEVASDHVVLDRGGIRETLWLDAGEGAVARYSGEPTDPVLPSDAPEPTDPPSDVPSPPPPSTVSAGPAQPDPAGP